MDILDVALWVLLATGFTAYELYMLGKIGRCGAYSMRRWIWIGYLLSALLVSVIWLIIESNCNLYSCALCVLKGVVCGSGVALSLLLYYDMKNKFENGRYSRSRRHMVVRGSSKSEELGVRNEE